MLEQNQLHSPSVYPTLQLTANCDVPGRNLIETVTLIKKLETTFQETECTLSDERAN